MRRLFAATLGVVLSASGCLCSQIPDLSGDGGSGGDASAPLDAGSDAGSDGGSDAGSDGGLVDAGATDGGGRDAGPDAGCVTDLAGLPPPIAYWALNEGAGSVVRDLSGYGNDGTFVAATNMDLPAWTSSGDVCGGLSFDGDGGSVVFGHGDGGLFDLTGSMTVSAWYFPTFFSANDMPIVSKRAFVPQRGWELYVSDNSAVFDVSTDGGDFIPQYGPAVLDAGVWHHAVGVFDADAGVIFLVSDGQLSGPLAVGPTMHDSTSQVVLGVQGGCTPAACYELFYGTVDEVRIWNVALTPQQAMAVP